MTTYYQQRTVIYQCHNTQQVNLPRCITLWWLRRYLKPFITYNQQHASKQLSSMTQTHQI